jgi:N6-adenosine-specific RNA methylase IME4
VSDASDQIGRLAWRPTSSLRPHPLSGELPPLTADDYQALKLDIAEHGLHVPLEATAAGVVLDGHARLEIARQLGLTEIEVLLVGPDDELAYMLAAALLRRHLSVSQRSALAVKLVDYEQLRAQAAERQQANLRRGNDEPEVANLPARENDEATGRTRDRIAALAGVSARTVQHAITVREHDPDEFQRVLAGEVKVSTAANRIDRANRDATIPPAPPVPDGPFQLILADPPWQMGSPDSPHSPEQHYPCMSLEEIKALKIPAADQCVLFLWGVNQLLPQTLDVVSAWGFTYRANIVWVKTDGIGLGVWLRQRHELLFMATRGISPPDPLDRVDSVINAPRTRHSEKPERAYELIERMYPQLTKLELFSRGTPRPGWTSWGNEVQNADPNKR